MKMLFFANNLGALPIISLVLFIFIVLPQENFCLDIFELRWFVALLDQYGVVVVSGHQAQIRVLFVDSQQPV